MRDPSTATPPVAVIVATRDRPDYVRTALDSILASAYTDFRVYIVDQSRSEHTARAIAPFLSDRRVQYLRSRTEGASAARNDGIRHARAEFLLFTDDDCAVDREWIGECVAFFRAHPSVCLTFGPVVPPAHTASPHRYVPVFEPTRGGPSRSQRRPCAIGMGANMGVRARLIERAGCFDEDFGPGAPYRSAEDVEFALRAVTAGMLPHINSRATVIHAAGMRSGAAMYRHWFDSGYGVGVLTMRLLHQRAWRELALLGRTVLRVVAGVASSLCAQRQPAGAIRLIMHGRGVVAGMLAAPGGGSTHPDAAPVTRRSLDCH